MNLKQILLLELQQLYPDIKPYLADRYISKYVSAVLAEVKQSLLRPGNENDELSFNTETLKQTCGRLDYLGKKLYLFAFMSRSRRTSLVIERFRGQLGKYKRVVLNEMYEQQIMYELLEIPAQGPTAQELKLLDQNANMVIPIDLQSLTSFIAKTREMIAITPQGKYLDALHKNYARATELAMSVETHEGQHYLKEYWVEADTGRQYGKFNSLQRMSKEVRHAALGLCHKYDFQAHSFAVMASIARKLQPDLKIAAIEDYIRYRTAYRQRIALEVGVSQDIIKTVFTSLGFGAKPIANPFNAIRRAVYSDQAFNKLMANDTFNYINEDLKAINQIVLDHFGPDEFELFGRTYEPRNLETNRRKNDSQRLAWIYQNTESALIKLFTDYIEQTSGQKPLITVHDCVYYKQRIPTEAFRDVEAYIRTDNEFEYVKMEHQAIYPISTQQQFDIRFEDNMNAEQEHKNRQALEQERAASYRQTLPERHVQQEQKFNLIDYYMNRGIPKEQPDYEHEYEPEDMI